MPVDPVTGQQLPYPEQQQGMSGMSGMSGMMQDPEFIKQLMAQSSSQEELAILEKQLERANTNLEATNPGGRYTRGGFVADNPMSAVATILRQYAGKRNKDKGEAERTDILGKLRANREEVALRMAGQGNQMPPNGQQFSPAPAAQQRQQDLVSKLTTQSPMAAGAPAKTMPVPPQEPVQQGSPMPMAGQSGRIGGGTGIMGKAVRNPGAKPNRFAPRGVNDPNPDELAALLRAQGAV